MSVEVNESLLGLAAAGIIAWHMSRYRTGERLLTRCIWASLGFFGPVLGLLLYFGFFGIIMDFIRRKIKPSLLQGFRSSLRWVLREFRSAADEVLRH